MHRVWSVAGSARRIAFVTGITGQDGSYLCELLLREGYTVHGIVRRSSSTVRTRIDHLTADRKIYGQSLFLHYAELEDTTRLRRLLREIQPNEVYHLAGQTHVGASFDIPESTCRFAAMGSLGLLEILRDCDPTPRLLHVSSSEIFGQPKQMPQNEMTPLQPATPYGVAKAFATQMVQVYRQSFGIFACNAICYNHESPRRGESFVTRKITRSAARIKLGLDSELILGNLDAQRDWGFAPDYVRGFHDMLQMEEPQDLVLATGKLHRVRDWLEIAFQHLDLDWRDYVKQDPVYVRKTDPSHLVGDASRAKQVLGWEAQTSFSQMVVQMVEADLVEASA